VFIGIPPHSAYKRNRLKSTGGQKGFLRTLVKFPRSGDSETCLLSSSGQELTENATLQALQRITSGLTVTQENPT
jgi:hypothetical protein